MCPFDQKAFCGMWECWDPVNRFNHTSWVAIVTPTYRRKSVRNRCLIDVFGGVCVLSRCFLGCFCGCRGFCYRTKSDLFLFSIFTMGWKVNPFTPIIYTSYM